jgi:hypothetical protein
MIREQLREVDENNQLVPLALGLRSVLNRFERLVERERSSAEAAASPSEGEDALVLAALGVLSLNRTLGRWLEVVCPEEAENGGEEESGDLAGSATRAMLRDLLR